MKKWLELGMLVFLPVVAGSTVVFSDDVNEHADRTGKTVIAPDASSVNIIIYNTDLKPKPSPVVVVSPPPTSPIDSEGSRLSRPPIESRQQRIDDLNKRSSYYRDKQ